MLLMAPDTARYIDLILIFSTSVSNFFLFSLYWIGGIEKRMRRYPEDM